MKSESAQLLLSVVRRGRADRVVALARNAGATGSTVLFGRGTATNKCLRLLCLADTEKEIVFTIAPAQIMPAIIAVLRQAPDLCKKVPGFGFTINVMNFIHSGKSAGAVDYEGYAMTGECNRQLICVVTNDGFADDLMHAARNAGATGGTILHARGTGTEADGSFFGITIVPEKEMLMILAPNEKAAAIMQAITVSPVLSEPGVGIMFTLPVQDFFPLGAKANR